MVELFISWCPGLEDDAQALRLIREDGLVSGVETCCVGEGLDRLRASGVKVSLHNPLRHARTGLSDAHFLEGSASMGVRDGCLLVDGPVVGFHVGYESLDSDRSVLDGLEERSMANVRGICAALPGKQVLFELPPVGRSQAEDGLHEARHRISSPEFVRSLVRGSDAGFLFDVAHMFITADAKIFLGEFDGTVEEYFDELLDAAAGRTYQLHVNVPAGDAAEGYSDVHRLFGDDALSDRILSLTRRVFERSPELLVITLEMSSGLPPEEHVRSLLRQARLLYEALNSSLAR